MNNRFVVGWWRYGVGVVLAVAMLFALAANAAPRGADEARRGTGKSGRELTRLITGDQAQINAVIAGTPPTAILAITPGAAPGSGHTGEFVSGGLYHRRSGVALRPE